MFSNLNRIEETLTELYSQNTIGTDPEREDIIVHEDSALQHLYYQSDVTAGNDIEKTYSYNWIDNDDGVNTLQEPHYEWQDANAWNDVEAHKQHATLENELYEVRGKFVSFDGVYVLLCGCHTFCASNVPFLAAFYLYLSIYLYTDM